MTKNLSQKTAARDLAAAEQIPYTAALRRVRAATRESGESGAPSGLDALLDPSIVSRTYTVTTFQPGVLDSGALPRPFHVLSGGHIWGQESWRGEPQHVIGFQNNSRTLGNDVPYGVWERNAAGGDPDSVLGSYIITRDGMEGTWNTWRGAIDEVVTGQTVTSPVVVTARFETKPDADDDQSAPEPFTFDVSPYLGALSTTDLRLLRKSGWSHPIATSMLYAARGLVDDHDPDLGERIEAACAWAEDRAEPLDDPDYRDDDSEGDEARILDTYVEAFTLAINPFQAEAYLDRHFGDLRLPRVSGQIQSKTLGSRAFDATALLRIAEVLHPVLVADFIESDCRAVGLFGDDSVASRLLGLARAHAVADSGSLLADVSDDAIAEGERFVITCEPDQARKWYLSSGASLRAARRVAVAEMSAVMAKTGGRLIIDEAWAVMGDGAAGARRS